MASNLRSLLRMQYLVPLFRLYDYSISASFSVVKARLFRIDLGAKGWRGEKADGINEAL